MQGYNSCLLSFIWYFSLSPCKVTSNIHSIPVSPPYFNICIYSIHSCSFATRKLSIAFFTSFLHTHILSTRFHTYTSHYCFPFCLLIQETISDSFILLSPPLYHLHKLHPFSQFSHLNPLLVTHTFKGDKQSIYMQFSFSRGIFELIEVK